MKKWHEGDLNPKRTVVQSWCGTIVHWYRRSDEMYRGQSVGGENNLVPKNVFWRSGLTLYSKIKSFTYSYVYTHCPP